MTHFCFCYSFFLHGVPRFLLLSFPFCLKNFLQLSFEGRSVATDSFSFPSENTFFIPKRQFYQIQNSYLTVLSFQHLKNVGGLETKTKVISEVQQVGERAASGGYVPEVGIGTGATHLQHPQDLASPIIIVQMGKWALGEGTSTGSLLMRNCCVELGGRPDPTRYLNSSQGSTQVQNHLWNPEDPGSALTGTVLNSQLGDLGQVTSVGASFLSWLVSEDTALSRHSKNCFGPWSGGTGNN